MLRKANVFEKMWHIEPVIVSVIALFAALIVPIPRFIFYGFTETSISLASHWLDVCLILMVIYDLMHLYYHKRVTYLNSSDIIYLFDGDEITNAIASEPLAVLYDGWYYTFGQKIKQKNSTVKDKWKHDFVFSEKGYDYICSVSVQISVLRQKISYIYTYYDREDKDVDALILKTISDKVHSLQGKVTDEQLQNALYEVFSETHYGISVYSKLKKIE